MLLAIIIVEGSPASQYLILDYRTRHGTLPLGWVAVVLQECWPMFLVLTSLLLWLFPDGTLPKGAVESADARERRVAARSPALVVRPNFYDGLGERRTHPPG